MVAKLIYALVFIAAFVVTTASLMYLNSKYENIFKFDFSPASASRRASSAEGKYTQKKTPDSEKTMENKNQPEDKNQPENKNLPADSTTTGNAGPEITGARADSIKKMQSDLLAAKQKLAAKERELQDAKVAEQARKDSAYVKWKKDIVKTYDKMDPRAVAKIIIKMNDDYARDILFTLKDKKRAQIIQLILDSNPEVASKLTKVP